MPERVPSVSSCDNLPTQGTATVFRRNEDGRWWISREDAYSDEVMFAAERAASCMLTPAPGDSVWFAREGDEVYILAILVRAADPDDLELEVS